RTARWCRGWAGARPESLDDELDAPVLGEARRILPLRDRSIGPVALGVESIGLHAAREARSTRRRGLRARSTDLEGEGSGEPRQEPARRVHHRVIQAARQPIRDTTARFL